MLKFEASRDERLAIQEIFARAAKSRLVRAGDQLDFLMDVEAVHSNGCPLDFKALLEFPEEDFAHDINGIQENIDRSTGALGNFFLPRCARSGQ